MAKAATVEDVIEALRDALDAAEALTVVDDDKGSTKRAAIQAINEIRAGRLADAITTLEREFLPKWADRDACMDAYRAAMEKAR